MIKKKPPDKNKVKKYENSLTYYKTIKTSLKSIVKYDNTIIKLNSTVCNVNKIVIHTFQFIKLYYLHCYSNNNELPIIDYDLVKNIMKIICSSEKEDKRGRKPKQSTIELKNKLKLFYDTHYKQLLTGENNLYFTHLNTLLDYETEKILTCFENHISLHFYDFFNRYINVIVNKKQNEYSIKNKFKDKQSCKKELSQYRCQLNRLKKDILLNEDKCIEKYKQIKDNLRRSIFNNFSTDNNYCYQVKCNPLDFIKILIKMSLEIEKKQEKTFNVFPMRKSIIPKYIKLDTATIIHLLFTKDMDKTFYLTKGNTKSQQHNIWNNFFRLEKKIFNKKGYTFNGEISTDGLSVSILFVRSDLYNSSGKNKVPRTRKPKGFSNEKYIDNLTIKEKKELQKYNVVGIDPGKSDLIFCTTKDKDENINTFRYSQIQRIKETRSKRYMKIIENDKKILKVGDDKTIKELETELSKFDAKSCSYENVKQFIKCKNKINNLLEEYYKKDLYRKLRWFSFINRQKTEDKMINNFKNKFGNPNKTIVCFGDYEQKKHLKFSPPTKGIGMRTLFRKSGYQVYLVDEYKTSKINHYNLQENEKFRKRQNPRPWKTNIVKYHGLLRSKSVPNSELAKQILVNRDVNGSLNIRMIALCHINKKKIPIEFSRKTIIQ